jgi:hypothetical protein
MPSDFNAVRLVINPTGMVNVTPELVSEAREIFFGESACVLG